MISARRYAQLVREREALGRAAAKAAIAGEPARPKPARWKDVLARFWGHVDIRSDEDCWLWMSTIDRRGYGSFQIRHGKNLRAHRFALEITNMAPIPPGLLGLHSCDTPACVNPAHLRVGTQSENLRDCIERGRHPYSNKTHCLYGHPFDAENTYWFPRGHRGCRICRRNSKLASSGHSVWPCEDDHRRLGECDPGPPFCGCSCHKSAAPLESGVSSTPRSAAGAAEFSSASLVSVLAVSPGCGGASRLVV